MNTQQLKRIIQFLLTLVAVFGISFFILGSVSTGLHTRRYNYKWFFGESYGIPPSFAFFVFIASILFAAFILHRLDKKLKLLKATITTQIYFSFFAAALTVIKLLTLDGWWSELLGFLSLLGSFTEIFIAVEVLSLLFLPASLLLTFGSRSLKCGNRTE